jgi:hypothetical protein
MNEANGDVLSLHRGNKLIGSEYLTFGVPTESYYGVTGETREPVLPRPQRAARKGVAARSLQSSPSPESRCACRIWWKRAQRAVTSMEESAAGSDGMQLAIAADELEQALTELWKLRASRDLNWQTILNHAQGMLRQAFADKRVETLTSQQCATMRDIVDRHLGTSSKSVDDLNDAVSLIEAAGFDPYAAISGDPLDDQNLDVQG